ncbi:MAG: D-alanyl-D-alanine carboxypeptidase [Firmicutes bacterium]|nr:D-alanyl-D-alanine carboxypeptidase [Bacillota bacterium]
MPGWFRLRGWRQAMQVIGTSACLGSLLSIGAGAAAAHVSTDSRPAPALAAQARSAVLMDASTGTVLFAKNEHERLPIASVTKIATLLLVFEALERGQVHMNDSVRTSDYAASMGGSQIFLEPGEKMSLSEMIKGIAVASANDAAVAVAEHIAGSESQFVRMMNDKARALGLQDTHFSNPNGLPIANHYSSAYDLAVLSRDLLRHEGVTAYTGLYSDHLRKQSEKPFWLVNTNKLIRFYSGMDGLKTGFTSEAKYCLAASARRNHLRMIAVVLGEPTSKVRNAEVTQMMDYAFSHYDAKLLYAKGQTVMQVPVLRGQSQAVAVTTRQTAYLLQNKVDQTTVGHAVTEVRPLVAPVARGQLAGSVRILQGGKVLAQYPLYTVSAVDRVSLTEMLGRSLRQMFLQGAGR